MRPVRWQAVACWALATVPVSQAMAAGTDAAVCRRGGVEWIVGGREAPQPGCEAAPAPRVGPSGTPPAARWRDSDGASERRRILEDELRHEQSLLAQALSQGPGADAAALGRTRANIAALQAELARVPPAR
ncbi:hypothetical protein [Ideonella sp. YS5]|uniref:hypothetical protein n=1 Tax=Ideonella sp. YS5 TaxID=3453714 RepID=UPI003EECE382